MLGLRRLTVTTGTALLLSACAAAPPTTADLADAMIAAMGGRDALEGVDTIVLRGGGTRTRLGQIPRTGGEDPMGALEGVTETIDLANGRAAFDNDIINGAFRQHRTEVLTTLDGQPVAWGNTVGRPNMATTPNGLFSWATQNSPAWLLRRNVITVALAAADTASDGQAAVERTFQGRTSLYGSARLDSGEAVGLYFNPETGLLDGFVAMDTESMLGDVEAVYILEDYREVDGLRLPHAVTILKEGRPYASIDYTSITINDPAALDIFTVPADVADQAAQAVASDGSWTPLAWNRIAPNVYHAVAFSHHSLVVEFPTFVAVVEGPYTEAQSLTLGRRIEAELGKPIRYVAPTHPHYDHTGGVRGLAALGADVLVTRGHEAELRRIVESPHTNPPDALARRAAAGEPVGGIEVFEATATLREGAQVLELYAVDTIPHVNPKVIAYVPAAGVLFQSDLFFGAASPDASALAAAIRDLNLNVRTIVGGHGDPLPFSALAAVAE